MRFRLLQSFLVVTTLSVAGTASAHFNLTAPVPANPADQVGGKGGKPCGPDKTPGTVTPVMGGSMLKLDVDEFVTHPGHYRVALVLNSRDELMALAEPAVMDKDGKVITTGMSVSAAIQNPPVFPVLADGVLPHTDGGGEQSAMIPLPNVNCDHCVLQVIEFMAQHGPDYFYRHCADLKITADPSKPAFDPNGMGGGGSGGSGGGGGGTGGASGGAGGASGGAAGSASGGSSSGGVPATGGVAGSSSTAGSAPATAGTSTGTAGSGSGSTPAAAEDDGGCSIAHAGGARTSFTLLAGSLLLGLGWFARRRNRPE